MIEEKYTTERVKYLQERRHQVKSSNSRLTDKQYRNMLGRIRAAGHFEFESLEKAQTLPIDEERSLTTIAFSSKHPNPGRGERPHLRGYVESPNPNKGPLR